MHDLILYDLILCYMFLGILNPWNSGLLRYLSLLLSKQNSHKWRSQWHLRNYLKGWCHEYASQWLWHVHLLGWNAMQKYASVNEKPVCSIFPVSISTPTRLHSVTSQVTVTCIPGLTTGFHSKPFQMQLFLLINGKGKVVSVHIMKAFRQSRHIAWLILNTGTGWRLTSPSGFFHPRKERHSIGG